ncbi:MAG: P27 family phage terminase small subunit [Candidatus Moranbacteria bacterium]|nr:P27 family phage terminase small subunit [Candidatus Moranbacteria bacterium]
MAEIQKPIPKGQKTPEGIRKVTLNLKRESVLKSGGFAFLKSGLAPGCGCCIFGQECEYYLPEAKICRSMVEFESRLEAQIMSLPQIQEIDRILVKRLCRNYGFLYITDKWLSKASPFLLDKNQFDFQPILKTRAVYERLIIHFCSALGLTPDARSRIGLNVAQTYSLAKELSELEYDEN